VRYQSTAGSAQNVAIKSIFSTRRTKPWSSSIKIIIWRWSSVAPWTTSMNVTHHLPPHQSGSNVRQHAILEDFLSLNRSSNGRMTHDRGDYHGIGQDEPDHYEPYRSAHNWCLSRTIRLQENLYWRHDLDDDDHLRGRLCAAYSNVSSCRSPRGPTMGNVP
jgi:hypothetical protein